jgi:glutamine synthetase
MQTDKGTNLLSPSSTPGRNMEFLSIFVSVLRGIYKHHYLMMAGVSNLNNFYRLGGNEAPPAIMSVFIGKTLDKVLNSIESIGSADDDQSSERAKLDIINNIPEILIDNTDRNRTSPFAFTGNRFEFRAVGSSVNVASSMFILNTIVAEQLTLFRSRVDTYVQSGIEKQTAIMKVIREFIVESKPIRFEGNGYSDEWRNEAAKRGLRGVTSVPEAYDEFLAPDTVEMFESQKVLDRHEIEARREVLDETFTKKLQIESRVMCDLTINHVIPTAIKWQNILLKNVKMMKEVFGQDEEAFNDSAEASIGTIKKISGYICVMHQGVHDMVEARKNGNKILDYTKKADVYAKTVLPYMDVIREKADKLEMIVDDELWPLPKYRELLFLM